MALALRADVSQRHLSFLESGRSNPSREMVLLLTGNLQVPLRECNELLLAAGFAPEYRESRLDGPQLAAANAAIDLILGNHERYPAVVMDRHWNLVCANGAAQQLFERLLGRRAASQPANVVRLLFAEDGLKPYLANWPQVAVAIVERVHNEAVGGVVDEPTASLLADIQVEVARLRNVGDVADAWPLVPLRFRKGDLAVDYFSMVTTLGTPRDIALQELRIECFFPVGEGDVPGAG